MELPDNFGALFSIPGPLSDHVDGSIVDIDMNDLFVQARLREHAELEVVDLPVKTAGNGWPEVERQG